MNGSLFQFFNPYILMFIFLYIYFFFVAALFSAPYCALRLKVSLTFCVVLCFFPVTIQPVPLQATR